MARKTRSEDIELFRTDGQPCLASRTMLAMLRAYAGPNWHDPLSRRHAMSATATTYLRALLQLCSVSMSHHSVTALHMRTVLHLLQDEHTRPSWVQPQEIEQFAHCVDVATGCGNDQSLPLTHPMGVIASSG